MVTSQSLYAINCEFFFFLFFYAITWRELRKQNIADSIQKGLIVSISQMAIFGEISFFFFEPFVCKLAVLIICVQLAISVPLPYTIVRTLFSQPHVVNSKSKINKLAC